MPVDDEIIISSVVLLFSLVVDDMLRQDCSVAHMYFLSSTSFIISYPTSLNMRMILRVNNEWLCGSDDKIYSKFELVSLEEERIADVFLDGDNSIIFSARFSVLVGRAELIFLFLKNNLNTFSFMHISSIFGDKIHSLSLSVILIPL
jgi:hypothetical protein